MATTKNALLRYKTIDRCLQNRYRKWTLNDLMDACNQALFEHEDRDSSVSKRTIQQDIFTMRSSKLGYNAPIVVYEKKYYTYEDPEYSIRDIPLNDQDVEVLTETVELLKQFEYFSLFDEVEDIVQRLEDLIYVERTDRNAIIHVEKNPYFTGLEHLPALYQAIQKQIVVDIKYQSFMADEPQIIKFHCYFIKQYDNRWYIIGTRSPKKDLRNLGLERILSITPDFSTPYHYREIDIAKYYEHAVGITVLREPGEHPEFVKLRFSSTEIPYIKTKPIHHSQTIVDESDNFITIEMLVYPTYELERIILGYGERVKVLAPESLKQKIKKRLRAAARAY